MSPRSKKVIGFYLVSSSLITNSHNNFREYVLSTIDQAINFTSLPLLKNYLNRLKSRIGKDKTNLFTILNSESLHERISLEYLDVLPNILKSEKKYK